MLFSKPPQSVGPLLFSDEEAEEMLQDLQKRGTGDATSNFLLIFSVAEIVEFKHDTHKLVRRLSSLCALLTYIAIALVGLWLLRVILQG